MPNIGPGELILILVIALVVLGPSKLPDVAQSLGKSVREFRKAATDVTEAGKMDAPAATPTGPIAPTSPTAATAPTTPATTPAIIPPDAPPAAADAPAPASVAGEPAGDSNQS